MLAGMDERVGGGKVGDLVSMIVQMMKGSGNRGFRHDWCFFEVDGEDKWME